jgi:UDP-N-acetylglucosamine 4,6-dehydratase
LYGATKAVAEKLFIHANTYTGGHQTLFCCCRYGNVLGSRGSLIPLLREQALTGVVTVTDAEMTRFWITLNDVAEFIIMALEQMNMPSIFIPKMPSMKIMDLVSVVAPDAEIRFIGARKGEKIDECLITHEEEIYCNDTKKFILYPLHDFGMPFFKKAYYSNTNQNFLSKYDLKKIIEDNNL